MKNVVKVILGASIAAVAASAATAQTLDRVKARGAVECGVNTALPGFAAPDDRGEWTGFDVDFCRAVAAAIFGDPTKVNFRPTNATERFTLLQSGDGIDLLARNTTWTLNRDTKLGFNFAGVNYYDGQGFMINSEKLEGIGSALELSGADICVQSGTTTELNLADYFVANNMDYNPVVFQSIDEVNQAYDAGRCDALTTDQSGLYASRLKLAAPDQHVVLPEIISKEPLGPLVRHGDDQWFDIVKWTLNAMLLAEELGITQDNLEEMKQSDNPEIRRVLGMEEGSTLGTDLGLTNEWVVNIVAGVGNYGEVFERNIGTESPLKIARGLNQLWTKGGIQYAMPIR